MNPPKYSSQLVNSRPGERCWLVRDMANSNREWYAVYEDEGNAVVPVKSHLDIGRRGIPGFGYPTFPTFEEACRYAEVLIKTEGGHEP